MAALAVAFYLARTSLYEAGPLVKHRSILRFPLVCRVVHDVFAAFVIALCAAMIVVRLRRPRPTLPQVFRQPGFIGCIASTLVSGMCILTMAERGISNAFFLASMANAYAIVAAWFAVLFVGSWNPEPGWIDRMARSLCVFWLIAPFVLCLGLTVV
jgi:hypothetical protein